MQAVVEEQRHALRLEEKREQVQLLRDDEVGYVRFRYRTLALFLLLVREAVASLAGALHALWLRSASAQFILPACACVQ